MHLFATSILVKCIYSILWRLGIQVGTNSWQLLCSWTREINSTVDGCASRLSRLNFSKRRPASFQINRGKTIHKHNPPQEKHSLPSYNPESHQMIWMANSNLKLIELFNFSVTKAAWQLSPGERNPCCWNERISALRGSVPLAESTSLLWYQLGWNWTTRWHLCISPDTWLRAEACGLSSLKS